MLDKNSRFGSKRHFLLIKHIDLLQKYSDFTPKTKPPPKREAVLFLLEVQ